MDKLLLLTLVARARAGGWASGSGPENSGKGPTENLITKLRVKIMPSTHILGFLLNPRDALGVRVQCQGILELRFWKGVELFKPDDGDILKAETRALLTELVIDLATAQKNLIHLLIALYERVRDDTPKSAHRTLL
jgi:hypothetical protein